MSASTHGIPSASSSCCWNRGHAMGAPSQLRASPCINSALVGSLYFFNITCPSAKTAAIPSVWKDKTWLERSYNGRDSDTVNCTMGWGLKIYLLSNEGKANQTRRERSASHKTFQTLSFCYVLGQHRYVCQNGKFLLSPRKQTARPARKHRPLKTTRSTGRYGRCPHRPGGVIARSPFPPHI